MKWSNSLSSYVCFALVSSPCFSFDSLPANGLLFLFWAEGVGGRGASVHQLWSAIERPSSSALRVRGAEQPERRLPHHGTGGQGDKRPRVLTYSSIIYEHHVVASVKWFGRRRCYSLVADGFIRPPSELSVGLLILPLLLILLCACTVRVGVFGFGVVLCFGRE